MFFSHASGVLSHKMEVNQVRLHFEMTGDGDHYVMLLPGALGRHGNIEWKSKINDVWIMNQLLNLTFYLLTVLFSIIFMAIVYTIPHIFKELAPISRKKIIPLLVG